MATYHVPIIYDAVTHQQRAAGCCDKIDPAFIGFSVSGIITQDSQNALYVKDGKLMCNLVSTQSGNMARYGDDRGVYIDGNDVLSNADQPNLLTLSATDKKVLLTKTAVQQVVEDTLPAMTSAISSQLISANSNNELGLGTDQKLYVDVDFDAGELD